VLPVLDRPRHPDWVVGMIRPKFILRAEAPGDHGTDWREDAACAGHDPELWHQPPSNEHARRFAIDVCKGCPVRDACLTEALADRSLAGIWGATTENQRRNFRPKVPRAPRPPCGTPAAYDAHLRYKEPTCAPCREAQNANNRANRARRKVG
jgi:WhiB family transcriptional regulator, redox-sensing transcriptional regulator